MKWNMIYYIIIKCVRSIISNFFPLLRVIISVLVLSNESVSVLSPGKWKSMPYHFDVDALGNGRFNGIPFHHQTKRSTN